MSHKNQGSNWIRREKRLAIYSRDGFCCLFCGRGAEDGVELTLDHVLPRELGGSNEASNLATACMDCNKRKGSQALPFFLMTLGRTATSLRKRLVAQLALPLNMVEGRRLLGLRKTANNAKRTAAIAANTASGINF